MSTHIWLNDPTILLRQNKLNELWPATIMTTEEKINAITRLVILLTFLGYLLTLSLKIIYIGTITLASIIILYLVQNKTKTPIKITEAFSSNLSKQYAENSENFVKPTEKNPLMNILVPEILYDPKRNLAAPSYDPDVEKELNSSIKEFIKKPFNKDAQNKLFCDIGDELMFNRSMIPWNSTPNTQIPLDLDAYKKFIYKDMISGKECNKQALSRHNGGAYNYTNP
jgi:hypothetical protein